MDKITRDSLIVLLKEHLTLWEMQIFTMKEVFRISKATSETLRSFGERMIEISQMNDPDDRTAALESLWPQLDQSGIQSDLGRVVARIESQHEKAGGQLDSLVGKLRSLVIDDA